MLSRRGLLGALLAAPVVIRTPGLLMPIKPVSDDGGFTTDNLLVTVTERYNAVWTDWRGVFGSYEAGDMRGFALVPIKREGAGVPFDPRDPNIELANQHMRELRRLEAEIAKICATA